MIKLKDILESIRSDDYYGISVGGISKEAHHFITDLQDSPVAVPSDSVIIELGRYVPKSSVILYRGENNKSGAGLKSWTYDKEIATGFAQVDTNGRVIKKSWNPSEILLDFTMLPQEYKDDLDKHGMGTGLKEVVCGYGTMLNHIKSLRGNV